MSYKSINIQKKKKDMKIKLLKANKYKIDKWQRKIIFYTTNKLS